MTGELGEACLWFAAGHKRRAQASLTAELSAAVPQVCRRRRGRGEGAGAAAEWGCAAVSDCSGSDICSEKFSILVNGFFIMDGNTFTRAGGSWLGHGPRPVC